MEGYRLEPIVSLVPSNYGCRVDWNLLLLQLVKSQHSTTKRRAKGDCGRALSGTVAIYQVSKYAGAPEEFSRDASLVRGSVHDLITGFCLIAVVYYFNASLYLIDASVRALEPWQAIAISLSSLIGGWIVYDLLCKSPLAKQPKAFALVGFALMTGAAYGLTEVLHHELPTFTLEQ